MRTCAYARLHVCRTPCLPWFLPLHTSSLRGLTGRPKSLRSLSWCSATTCLQNEYCAKRTVAIRRPECAACLPQVRALCACELGLFTASRDKSVKLWTEGADGKLSVATTYVGHTSYVTAVAYIAPGATPQWPKGALVSGAPARASADLSSRG